MAQMSGDEDPRADLRWGTVPRLVEDAADRHPDAEAVVDGDIRLTYGELAQATLDVTRGLMASGVARGDRVAIWAPNSAQWIVAALGVLGAGGILVTLNTRFKGAEAAYILRASGARTLFTVRGFLGVDYPALLEGEDLGQLSDIVVLRDHGAVPAGTSSVGPVRPLGDLVEAGSQVSVEAAVDRGRRVEPTDMSDLLFTSGTTGKPKGATSTHAVSLRTFGTWASIVGLRADDRYLVVNPFFHTFGYKAGILACLMTGAALLPEAVFDVDRVLETVAAQRVSVLPGPPTLYQSILDHPRRADYNLRSLRLGVTGAAVVPVELVEAMRGELGFDTVLTAYGLTESCGTVTMCRRTDPAVLVATTSGRAIPDLEVRVVGPEGELPRGEPGEIVVRGYTVMDGYWNDPEATAEAIDAEGWLHTGDIGTMDAEGYVQITDRVKDMFVVGGFNAYPAEIEAMLRGSPAIAQVAVIGVPDERMGEVGCAFVVPSSPAEAGPELARELVDWSRSIMANYKAPRHVEFVDALPVNASGKVLKTELRRTYVERQAVEGGRHERSEQQ
jgi:HIP---CoA ligase